MPQIKKILIIMDGIGPPNARGSDIIYEIYEWLAQNNWEVHILTLVDLRTATNWRDWMNEKEKKYNIHFHYFHLTFFKKFHAFYFRLFKIISFFQILFLQRKYQFDIIHEYIANPVLLLKADLIRFFVSNQVKIFQTLCTASPNNAFLKKVKKFQFPIICHDKTTHKLLLDNGCNEKNVFYLPIGLDVNKFNTSEKISELPINKIKILYTGLIEDYKGVFLLANLIPDLIRISPNLFFIFSCPETQNELNKKQLLNIIEQHKENCLFLSGLSDIPRLLNSVDIVVYPLKTPYGTLSIPLTLLEAMAARKAIVASDIGNNGEVIQNNITGFLFPVTDLSKLKEHILELSKNDSLCATLGDNARRFVNENFNFEKNCLALSLLYEENNSH